MWRRSAKIIRILIFRARPATSAIACDGTGTRLTCALSNNGDLHAQPIAQRAVVILGYVALAACVIDYGYNRYYGYGPYGPGAYGYGPYGDYPGAPVASVMPGMAPATYVVPQSLSQAS